MFSSFPRSPCSHILCLQLRGEHLNATWILEGGRKQRKNWTSVWSVLTSEQLLLYKEEVGGAQWAGLGDVIAVCGAAARD